MNNRLAGLARLAKRAFNTLQSSPKPARESAPPAVLRRLAARCFAVAFLALGLGFAPGGRAEVHTIPGTGFSSEDWLIQVRVDGQFAKFCEEGAADGYEKVVLYTSGKPVTLTLTAEYLGTLPPDVTRVALEADFTDRPNVVWAGMDGGWSTTIDPGTNKTLQAELLVPHGSFLLRTSDPLLTPSVSFSAQIVLARPISVSAGYSGSVFSLFAYEHTPYIRTNVNGQAWVDYRFTPLPDASVRATSLEVVTLGDSGWQTTDELGRARTTVTAPLGSEVDEAGYVKGKVLLKATKDRAGVEREQEVRIPFASVESAAGAQLVGRQGAILDPLPIFSGQQLRPGDIVQVGSEVATDRMHLKIRFCNGEIAWLLAETFSGMRAMVGSGGLGQPVSVLKVSLKNFAQSVAADPRRYGRTLVYKAVGNAIDGFLGIPDPVSWSVTTPGGKVEDWMADYLEPNYQRTARRSAGPGVVPADLPVLPPGTPWAATTVDFYSDGSARVSNQGATVRVRGPAATAVIPRGGLGIAQLHVPGGAVSDVGFQPRGGQPPALTLTPADGATEVERLTTLRLGYHAATDNPVLPGSLVCRLDGRLISPFMVLGDGEATYRVPAGAALSPGQHRWEVELTTLQGLSVRTSATFAVSTRLPAPAGLQVAAGLDRVALRWDAASGFVAPGGFRVERSSDGNAFEAISGATPLRRPNFADTAPLARGFYRVIGLDESGQPGPPSAVVAAAFPGSRPAALVMPGASAMADPAGGGIRLLLQQPAPTWVFWEVERAPAANGPFTGLLAGERLGVDDWTDTTASVLSNYWYRVTPHDLDGMAGPSVTVGPIAWQPAALAVTGLTARLTDSGAVEVRWNPYLADAITGYRVYRRAEGGPWSLAGSVAAGTESINESALAGGPLYEWKVVASLASGGETGDSAAVALRWQPVPAAPGVVRFAEASQRGVEGDSVPVRIIRQGGSQGPAFVTWSSWWTGGTASQDIDFTPGGGLLVFNDGETEKTVQVPLLTDSQQEWPEEYALLQIRQIEGGPALGEPSQMQVFISEGALLAWDNTWLNAREGTNATVTLAVNLSAPLSTPVQVDFAFQPDMSTATPDADFTGPLNGTLVFAPGQTRQSFTITVKDDALKEGSQAETIKYRLLNPQGAAAIDASDPFRPYLTLQIDDDDTRPGRPVLAERELRLREGQSVTLTLQRVDGSDGPLNVFLFPMGGSATADADWKLDPAMPQFAAGQTGLQLTLQALADQQSEGVESALLGVQGQGMAGPGQMQYLWVLIEDDPPAASGFSAWADASLAGVPAGQRVASSDADGDGVPNWLEYVWRTRPDQPDRPPLPQVNVQPWGGIEVTVTLAADPAYALVAEFASDVNWTSPQIDPGTWTAPADGQRQATFRYYPAGGSAFIRWRCYWQGMP